MLARETLQGDLLRPSKAEIVAALADRFERGRDQDLAAAGGACDARRQDDVLPKKVVRLADYLAGVQTDADVDRLVGGTVAVCREGALETDRRAGPTPSAIEGAPEAAALRLYPDPALRGPPAAECARSGAAAPL